MAETAQLIPNVLNSTEMFDKTFHSRLDNMTQINIGGTWHPVTDVSHVTRGTGCVVNLKQLSMYFRVHCGRRFSLNMHSCNKYKHSL